MTLVSRGHPSIPAKKKNNNERGHDGRPGSAPWLGSQRDLPSVPRRCVGQHSCRCTQAARRRERLSPHQRPSSGTARSGEECAPPRSGLGPITGVSAVPLAPMARLMDGESGRPVRQVVTERRTRLGLRRTATCSSRPCCPGPRQRRRCPPAAVRQVLPGREPPGRSPSLLLRPSFARRGPRLRSQPPPEPVKNAQRTRSTCLAGTPPLRLRSSVSLGTRGTRGSKRGNGLLLDTVGPTFASREAYTFLALFTQAKIADSLECERMRII